MSIGFLIDTNVLSELMRENPAPQVLAWFASQNANLMQTSAIIGIAYVHTRTFAYCI